jgi:hypothetical protein
MFATWSRRIRSTVVIATVSLGLVAAVATPANAGTWIFTDGFENNPAASWWCENPDVYSHCDFGGHDGAAHSGSGYVDLYRFAAGWNSVDHSLSLPSGLIRSCVAEAWFQGAYGTRFNIEIIDPVSWTYVTLGQFTVNNSAYTWQSSSISWGGGPNNVVLRFVLVSNSYDADLKVDDAAVVCSTFP